MIISYDATGNILVEQQVTLNNTGYPTALELSGRRKSAGGLLSVYTAEPPWDPG